MPLGGACVASSVTPFLQMPLNILAFHVNKNPSDSIFKICEVKTCTCEAQLFILGDLTNLGWLLAGDSNQSFAQLAVFCIIHWHFSSFNSFVALLCSKVKRTPEEEWSPNGFSPRQLW